ncbi:NeuD/PglB/VioB family sugar acetyltransferase [Pseudodesulfovibrio methanolicus]|uniref:NeuD/PglB/VioB family sugar acetyltransferase n=1 Tax=Pseudodesulfovibrio methanolicus TaxID=3126690 RepID=A0ABZ2ITN4_9BACT
MTNSPICIVGAGAQAKYSLDTMGLLGLEAAAVIRFSTEHTEFVPDNIPVYDGGRDALDSKEFEHCAFIMARPNNREKLGLIQWAREQDRELVTLIHPKAVISHSATIGQGCLINAGAVIQPHATIGDGVMIHANVVVEHDAVVEECANLAPMAALAGWVRIGTCATVFTGARCIPGVQVGADSIIAAGATVIENIPEKSLAAGTPAVIKKSMD